MDAISSQGRENCGGSADMSGARISGMMAMSTISGMAISTISSSAFAQPIKRMASVCSGIGLIILGIVLLCSLLVFSSRI